MTPTGRGAGCARARRRSRPTSACRSRGWRSASPRPSATSPNADWWRRSSAMSATAISISRCWSTWTMPAEVKAAKVLCERLVERALAMDGTCTGEHGVGQGKMKYLAAELGAPALAAMAAIKRALDPHGIMNPGKIVPLGLTWRRAREYPPNCSNWTLTYWASDIDLPSIRFTIDYRSGASGRSEATDRDLRAPSAGRHGPVVRIVLPDGCAAASGPVHGAPCIGLAEDLRWRRRADDAARHCDHDHPGAAGGAGRAALCRLGQLSAGSSRRARAA